MEEPAEWRVTLKERERERRRMRDRQRRQSMSIEERERHLARRRRNYQLRRQRAAVSDHDQMQQAIKNDTTEEASTSKHHNLLPLVCTIPQPNLQHAVPVSAHDNASPAHQPLLLSGESTYSRRSYKYPRVLRLTQIKRLARLLNSQLQKPEPGSRYKDIIMTSSPQSNLMIKGIRLIHVKHLARALSSSVPKSSLIMHRDEEHPCTTQGIFDT